MREAGTIFTSIPQEMQSLAFLFIMPTAIFTQAACLKYCKVLFLWLITITSRSTATIFAHVRCWKIPTSYANLSRAPVQLIPTSIPEKTWISFATNACLMQTTGQLRQKKSGTVKLIMFCNTRTISPKTAQNKMSFISSIIMV